MNYEVTVNTEAELAIVLKWLSAHGFTQVGEPSNTITLTPVGLTFRIATSIKSYGALPANEPLLHNKYSYGPKPISFFNT